VLEYWNDANVMSIGIKGKRNMSFVLHQSYWEQCEYEVGVSLGHTNIASSLVQGINTFFYQAIS
jgi:hypothetical protein